MTSAAHQETTSAFAIIIGTGFGGLGMAIQLRQQGIEDFIILEKTDSVGGCWRDNSYPGAACDVPSHLYSFSFERKFDWSRKFAPQAEILDYLRHCAQKYDLLPRIRFHTEVSAARFDEDLGQWQVEMVQGRYYRATVLISACGQLNRPAYPKLPGIEAFQGKLFHSAEWDHGYDLTGKRVGVIGTGASAIQFVPEIAPQVAHLTLFQRSAPYVIPKPDSPYEDPQQQRLARLPALHSLSRLWIYLHHEVRALAFNRFTFLMKLFEVSWARYLKQCVADPELRRKLTPDYPMGCKRILISNTYYQSLVRPNVEVVVERIREVRAQAVVTDDGMEHPVDAIVLGTGFQSTDFLAPMRIVGRGGLELNQAWRDGAEAYLGMTVSGFPNLFMLYGPNTNLGHNSIVFMLESQMHYILQAVKVLHQTPGRYFDLKADVQSRFNQDVQRAIRKTIWEQGCTSWYKNEAGKNTNNWPGFTLTYRRRTRRFNPHHYEHLSAR